MLAASRLTITILNTIMAGMRTAMTINDHFVILRCMSAHAPILRSSASIDSLSFMFSIPNYIISADIIRPK